MTVETLSLRRERSAESHLTAPAAPLLTLAEALGIAPEILQAQEGLRQLSYQDANFSRERAARLELAHIRPAVEAYGQALTCRFLLGEQVVLTVGSATDEAALAAFREATRLSPIVELELTLDKVALAQRWLGYGPTEPSGRELKVLSTCQPFLFLFPETLAETLTNPLGRLEERLFTVPERKVLLLAPGADRFLDGEYLALVSGAHLARWREAAPQTPPDEAPAQALYTACRERVKWVDFSLRRLTPLHLAMSGQAPSDDAATLSLRTHLVNLIILYTADRTVLRDGQLVATYAGANYTADVTLPGLPLSKDMEVDVVRGAEPLLALLNWTYHKDWAADRLPLVQTVVAQGARAGDPKRNYRWLLENAGRIHEELQWSWKAFLEGKLDVYMERVREVEDYAAEKAQAFADQVLAMIRTLMDNVLAAVAVLIGSFIGSVLGNEFNPRIFRLSLLVYIGYVLVFPVGYGMLNAWQGYRAAVEEFKARYRRFNEQLYPDKVEQIVGDRVEKSQRRFRRWFWIVLLTYVAVVLLAAWAVWQVPAFITSSTPTPTPIP